MCVVVCSEGNITLCIELEEKLVLDMKEVLCTIIRDGLNETQ